MASYLLIEDERLAREEIKRMMLRIRPDYRLCGEAESVQEAVECLKVSGPDLLVSDVCLADGLCFEIFERSGTDIPVIFTTAYDEYAIKAFKQNSIDYLLKPIDEKELGVALAKFEKRAVAGSLSAAIERLKADMLGKQRKNRFLVQNGDSFRYIETKEVAFFYSEDKYVHLQTFGGGRHIINHSLDLLEELLDGTMFFRVSRNCIVNIRAVVGSSRYFGGRMLPIFKPECPLRVTISRSRVAKWLKWLDGTL